MSATVVKSVVCAITGSLSSIHAAMYSIIMAKEQGFDLKFVYVIDTATIKKLTLNKFLLPEESKVFEASIQMEGEKHLDYVMELAKKKDVKVTGELRKGSVCIELVKCVKETQADILVIGGETTHTDKYTLEHNGSLSIAKREILTACPCTVLMVNEPRIEELYKLC